MPSATAAQCLWGQRRLIKPGGPRLRANGPVRLSWMSKLRRQLFPFTSTKAPAMMFHFLKRLSLKRFDFAVRDLLPYLDI